MSGHGPEGIRKEVKIYRIIGAVLIAGTIITVTAANAHLGILLGIAVAILIAAVKGSLVAGYFMHLFTERKLIYGVLALTAVFIVVMVGLIMFSYGDQQGRHQGAFPVPVQHVTPHHSETSQEKQHVP